MKEFIQSASQFLWVTFRDKKNLIRFTLATAAIIVGAQFMPSIIIASFWVFFLLIAVTIALLVGAKPALNYLKIPYSILTFGLFLWIGNGLILLLLDWLLWYFETTTWWWVFLYALVQAIVNCMVEVLIEEE